MIKLKNHAGKIKKIFESLSRDHFAVNGLKKARSHHSEWPMGKHSGMIRGHGWMAITFKLQIGGRQAMAESNQNDFLKFLSESWAVISTQLKRVFEYLRNQ
ncbi:MAG: hypothetical protein ACU826_08695, partial [Gammaproteobacteria bacterium]